jgi:hypothetical protein
MNYTDNETESKPDTLAGLPQLHALPEDVFVLFPELLSASFDPILQSERYDILPLLTDVRVYIRSPQQRNFPPDLFHILFVNFCCCNLTFA